jgi:hypothetical protein
LRDRVAVEHHDPEQHAEWVHGASVALGRNANSSPGSTR